MGYTEFVFGCTGQVLHHHHFGDNYSQEHLFFQPSFFRYSQPAVNVTNVICNHQEAARRGSFTHSFPNVKPNRETYSPWLSSIGLDNSVLDKPMGISMCYFLLPVWKGKGGQKFIFLQSRLSCWSSSNVYHVQQCSSGDLSPDGCLKDKNPTEASLVLSSPRFHLTHLNVWSLGQVCEEQWVPLAIRCGVCISAVAKDNDWQ